MNLKHESKRIRKYVFLMLMFFGSFVFAQNQKTVSGTVKSGSDPLPGASVIVKNSKIGTETDFDGKFTLSVPSNATTLVVSYLGYVTKEVAITSGEMSIVLEESANSLDEVVINVGYGSQKKSVVTGSISKVNAQEIENKPISRVENILQGSTTGVVVATNNGQPGASSTIRVRGITTFDTQQSGNDPLWVVDGVILETGALGTINQSDIESIEVLKDAASLAIYGARAASGVILITTKKGRSGEMKIAYTGNFTLQTPSKFVQLLNAPQYMAMMNEKAVNSGKQIPYLDLNQYGLGTDWQKAIFNNAVKYSNELNFSGATEKTNYYFSLGNIDQDGIILKTISNYKKQNVRLNLDFKVADWLTIGEKSYYTHEKTVGIGNTNSEYGGPLSSALNLDPLTPIVEYDPVLANGILYQDPYIIRDNDGNPYGISQFVGQEMTNPIAYQQTRLGQYSAADNIFGNIYAEAKFLNDFKFKTTFGGKIAMWKDEGFNPIYFLSNTVNNTTNSLYRNKFIGKNWTIENTLTYAKDFNRHSINLLIGQGMYEDGIGAGTYLVHRNLSTNNYEDATFNDYSVTDENKDGSTYNFTRHTTSSYFTRLNYNFDEKYLFTGILRRDGSSKFGANYKFGTFPSFSLGWVVSKEGFWKENDIVNTLKIRGGYGVTGNDRIPDFQYMALISGGSNYTWTNSNEINIGVAQANIENPDLHWEETAQTNVGFEMRFLRNFNFTFDWFKKETSGILRPIPIPGYVGAQSDPIGNVADMSNKGIELELGYKKAFDNWSFGINTNFSTLENEVTYLGYDINRVTTYSPGFQSMGSITITQVGLPYNSFYGYQTDGIFQNQDEIAAYTNSTGGMIQPNAVPGDFRWKDLNGDGTISDDDRTDLGTFLPKYNFGLNLNAKYKKLDLVVQTYGAGGNKIFKGYRRLDMLTGNYMTEVLDRWHGEGTSNDYPRLTDFDTNGNFSKMSNFYLQDASFLKIKNVMLGYTVDPGLKKSIGVSSIRLTASVENLWTFTKYNGYDPEVGGTVMGFDRGNYPQSRNLLFGLNVQF